MYDAVLKKYDNIISLSYIGALLNWDQSTYMPKQGVVSRANCIELVATLIHDKLASEEFYKQINEIYESGEYDNLDEFKKTEIGKIKRTVDKQRKLPADLVAEMAKTTSLAMSSWQEAKKMNDDKDFLPYLKKIFSLKKRVAECYGYEKNPYDALLDEYDEGLRYDLVQPLFTKLEKDLVEIIQRIKNSPTTINSQILKQDFNVNKQFDFGLEIAKDMGIDFDCFRQDTSAHPFTTTIGNGDVRITTDVTLNNFKKGLFSTIHEAGHALYEINTGKKLQGSPLAHLESLSLHESQSRFYENIICRSKMFWDVYYSRLLEYFPEPLHGVSHEEFYACVNEVKISPIRVEADEVTYNLHIVIRTGLENAILNNEIEVKDINEAWNAKTNEVLGFIPETMSTGYLQDIHWSDGLIGYFPTYAMGNLISAQLYQAMQKEIGTITTINKDVLQSVLSWFKKNIYDHGARFTSPDLVKRVTGEELDASYFTSYIKNKYNGIYK